MNSIILLPEECLDERSAVLTGARASYLFKVHELRKDLQIKVAVINGMRGVATVESASEDRVQLNLLLNQEPFKQNETDLIVGISRPQTVKKVIQAAVMLGARSLHFVKTERGVKSYTQSHSLRPEEIQAETIKALEQINDSNAPTVEVHRSFHRFYHDVLGELVGRAGNLIVADPSGERMTFEGRVYLKCPVIIAVGAELGWTEGELTALKSKGFKVVSLGERVMRVEIALVYLLAQIDLIKSIG